MWITENYRVLAQFIIGLKTGWSVKQENHN
jgi:hypothetical protein